MAAPHRYPYDIPSVHDVNPGLAANLLMTFDRAIVKGDVIAIKNLDRARAVAAFLRAYRMLGHGSFITDEVVESARLRIRAVEAAHVMALYAPVDLVNELQNRNEEMKNVVQRMNEMEQRMNDMEQAMKDMQVMKDLAKDGYKRSILRIGFHRNFIAEVEYLDACVSQGQLK